MKFAPNAQLIRSKSEYQVLEQQLRGRVVSRPFEGCEARADDGEPTPDGARPSSQQPTVVALAASFNEQANADAPPEVRAAVARDSQTLTGRTAATILDEMARRLPQGLQQRLAENAALLESVERGGRPAANAEPSGNPVTRGAKSIGGGLKRLFGSGKKPAKR